MNILHISDAHIQRKDEQEIRKLVEKLLQDLSKVQEEQNLRIDLVCFTGDLIQRGDMAVDGEAQWQLAKEILVIPLMEFLNMSNENFIFVPGNHEVDISNILEPIENGLQVHELDKIDSILKKFAPVYIEREKYLYEIVKQWYPDVYVENLGYSFMRNIGGKEIGIVCLDSAWRSTGCGMSEKGKLYVGNRQIEELLKHVQGAEFKICLMHHPIEWLEECEVIEIEKLMTNFDIVLRGHVHDADDKQIIRQNLKTIYSTAGKLYPLDYAEGRAVDGYNGYTIININLEKNECTLFLRTYFGKNRKEFAAAENICEKGIKKYSLNFDNEQVMKEFHIVKGIELFFNNMSEKYALIKNVDSDSPEDIRQVLVSPVLADRSEYVKEEGDSSEVDIANVVDSTDNILLIGKKESGKTTILQQIALDYIDKYEEKKAIPVYIDMRKLFKGEDRIEKTATIFILDNLLEEGCFTKTEINQLYEDGKIVFLLDNVDSMDVNHSIWIKNFFKKYANNRYILSITEEFFESLDVKQLPEYVENYREIYVQYMGKAQIREMVTRWAEGREDIGNINDVVNKIDSYCNQINFAKTPFNISVFMVLWDADNNFIPVNEGIVMQNYLHIILEKMSPKESLRTTYSFVIKQDFLSFLAHEMFLKNEYYFTYDEFMDRVVFYHRKKGYNLQESNFDKIFFEKNILNIFGNSVSFSHTSFLEYFLAVYANNDKEFLKFITTKGNRIYFRNEICFYSGLNQNCTELLDDLSDTILQTVIQYLDLVDYLNEVEILTEFKLDKEDLIESLKRNRPTQRELDDLSDQSNKYRETKPSEINKGVHCKKNIEQMGTEISVEEGGAEVANDKLEEVEAEDFFSLLQMYGSVIKNAELLDNSYKIEHLEFYMYGMNSLYAITLKLLEQMQAEKKFSEMRDSDKQHLNITSEEEFEKMKKEMVDISKLIIPIAIQNLIYENIGTPKLDAAIVELIESKQSKPFEKFMLEFLRCDLKLANMKNELSAYINSEESKSVLKLILFKLTFYYRARFFGINRQMDEVLIELITVTQMKLNPVKKHKLLKSRIARQLKIELDNGR